MSRRFALLLPAAALTVLVPSALAGRTLADGSATVTTSVAAQAAAAPCLVIVGNGAVDFGSGIPFSESAANPSARTVAKAVAPDYRSCATAAQDVTARATRMSNGAGTSNWTPAASVCGAADEFHLSLIGGGQTTTLETADQTVQKSLAANATGTDFDWRLDMPCAGSSGAGEAMNGQVVFTATLS